MQGSSQDPIQRIVNVYDKITADDEVTPKELDIIADAIIKNNLTNYGSLKKIIDALFQECGKSLTNDVDKKRLTGLQKVTDIIVDHFMESKPQVLDALFFPSEENESKFIKYLSKAQKKMVICVFTISNHKIANCLENLHKRGVSIRIISDDACMENIGSDIHQLSQRGIPVRTDNDLRSHMHNKFCVVDDSFLITGSFNWTSQAVRFNQENIMITDFPDMVTKYGNEFERLWKLFERNKV